MKITLVLIAICIFGSVSNDPTNADELIKPIATFSGTVRMAGPVPTDKVITDQTTLDELWQAWGADGELPVVDWENQLMVAAIAHGPNNVSVTTLKLSDQGDLTYAAASTRMGGPGFGYCFVQIPSAGVKSVNSKPIPNHGVGQKQADEVQVNIAGTLQTGLVAIGGETTGTAIGSGDITFEVDLSQDDSLQQIANRLNGQRVRLKGVLTQKRGVEIRIRWIVVASSISKLKEKKVGNEPAFETIKVNVSGGFAGISEEWILTKNGEITISKRRQRVTETWQLSKEKLREINRRIAHIDWANLQPTIIDKNVADAFQYEFTIDTGKMQYQIQRDEPSLAKDSALSFLQHLNRKE